jgi:hypothetical protein
MELNQELLQALELAAWDPNHALGRVEAWPAGAARPSPPATPEQVQASQRRLGFSLPVPLRQVVMQVANGGFGPGYGLLGLEGGATDDLGDTAVDSYLVRRSWDGQQGWRWPERLVPICTWGCGIYTCMICEQGSIGGRLVRYDPDFEDELWQFRGEGRTVAQWLGAWLDGQDLWELEASDADEEAELAWWQQRLGPPWGQRRLFQ